MPYETVAEGIHWKDFRAALPVIQPGQSALIELDLDRDITLDEVRRVEQVLAQTNGVVKIESVSGHTMRLSLKRARESVEEQVGIVWFLPLIAVGGILTVLAGWRIMTARPADMLRVLIPVALVGLGAWLIYSNVRKWPRERNE